MVASKTQQNKHKLRKQLLISVSITNFEQIYVWLEKPKMVMTSRQGAYNVTNIISAAKSFLTKKEETL